jgi:xanthosine utilization system XapX-like protein
MPISRRFTGALAGFLATIPMTAFMVIAYQYLPEHERYPLHPSEIVTAGIEEPLLRKPLNAPQHVALTLVFHFGYGITVGAVCTPLMSRMPFPPVLRGTVCGLAIWAIGYLGWLPAMRILHPATQYPPHRRTQLILAHVVWGSALGIVADRFEGKS